MTKRLINLRDVREDLFGLRIETVLQATGLSRARLEEIEAGDDTTVNEIEALARVYGIDSDRLSESPISFKHGDGIQLLASLDEFKDLGDFVRLRVIYAATAARDLVTLQQLEQPGVDRIVAIRREIPRLKRDPRATSDFREGADLAKKFRSALRLGTGPVPSVTRLLAEAFPSLNVLYADLSENGPAGVCFTDDARGPTIVMNVRGKNENILVRRFHLAHEFCHLLVDWGPSKTLVELSGFLNETQLPRERRANAFAVRFLCPESVLKKIDITSDPAGAAKTLAPFGLHYAALRLYLWNEAGERLPAQPSPEFAAIAERPSWRDAEGMPELEPFPLPNVPLERRNLVAHTAARLYSKGMLRRDAFAEYLRVAPSADLERVLDFFALSPPLEDEAAA